MHQQTQLKLGWYVSSVLFVAAFFGPAPMGSISYVYNEYHAAVYAALGPMAWCGLFAWIVFTSHLGYESKSFNVFLCSVENNIPFNRFPQ